MKRLPRRRAKRLFWGLFALMLCAMLGAVTFPAAEGVLWAIGVAGMAAELVLVFTALRCPECGSQTRVEDKFCPKCGAKLEEET